MGTPAATLQDPALFWTAVAAIGQVAGALATALAVIVSLWVVLSERRPRLRIIAGLRLIIAGDGSPASDAIGITVANIGMRRVRCVGIGWRSGHLRRGPVWLRRQHALQNADYLPGSATLPFDLEPGDEKTLLLAVESYQAAMGAAERAAFFFRKAPWSHHAKPTRIDVIVSLAAHPGIFARTEPGLAHFLSHGSIQKGAAHFNERAATASGC